MLTLFAALVCRATVESGVQPVTAWATELSERLTEPVHVEKALRDVPLLVVSRSGSPELILHAIATALHASVVHEKDGAWIMRTKADIDRDEATLLNERAGWISHRLKLNADHRLALTRQGMSSEMIVSDLSSAIQARNALRTGQTRNVGQFNGAELLPESVLLEALISRIGVRAAAAAKCGMVTVYEDDPPGQEKPLPEHSDLLAQYKQSVELLDSSKVPPTLQNQLRVDGNQDLFKYWGLPNQAARVRIVEIPNWNGLQFLIEVFDSNGRRLGGSGLFAGKIDGPLHTTFMLEAAKSQKAARWVDLPAASAIAMEPELDPKTRTLPQWYYNPTKTEPLNLFAACALSGMASEESDQPTVIVANDGMWNLVKQCRSGNRISVDTFERALKEEFDYEKLFVQGAAVWRPVDPLLAEGSHADRAALQRFARALQREGQVSLRSLCELYADSNADLLSLANAWSSIADRVHGTGTLRFDRSPKLLKLLGKIPDDQWDKLMSSTPATLAELGVATEFASYLVNDLTVRTEGAQVPDLDLHPAELLPNGPLPDAAVKFSFRREEVIQLDEAGGWIPQSDFVSEPMGGVHLSSVYKDGKVSMITTREDFESQVAQTTYRMGNLDELTIRLQLRGNLFVSAHVRGNAEPTSGVLAYKDLPPEMRDKIWSNACQRVIDRNRRDAQQYPAGPPGPGGSPHPR